MSIKISKLRDAGKKLGREGVSELALKYVGECDGSYKGVMELCGKMSVLARAATFDDYWSEQVFRGKIKAEIKCADIAEDVK